LNFWGKHIRLEGNHIHDVVLINLNNTNFPNGGGWPTCLGTMPWVTRWSGIPGDTWADDVVIRANRVENCWGEGIGIWYGTNVVAEDNVVINPWCVGIYLDNSYGVRVSRNFVHVTNGREGSQGMGVALATEPYDSWEIAGSATHDVEIHNNVIVAGIGIAWFRMTTNPNPTNTYANISVLFNTVLATEVNALGFMEVLAGAPIPSGCVAKNNVFVEASASWIDNIGGWTLAGNAWLNEAKPWQAGVSDVSLTIAVPTISSAIDAKPLAGKVGTGESGTSVTGDFLCAARDPARPVRGAFER
jgi:parallel beta-helix repeat protein